MNVLLIGFRGAGKTTVARLLALKSGWAWIDADVELELRAGKSIAAIFADDGETAFRDLESRVLADLVHLDRHVIALGGGAVLRPENRALIRSAGPVVWLTTDAATARKRIQTDAATVERRPALTSQGKLAEVEQLLAEREPWYQECASLTVDTRDKTPSEIADSILARLPLK